jgi:hypothetical protein
VANSKWAKAVEEDKKSEYSEGLAISAATICAILFLAVPMLLPEEAVGRLARAFPQPESDPDRVLSAVIGTISATYVGSRVCQRIAGAHGGWKLGLSFGLALPLAVIGVPGLPELMFRLGPPITPYLALPLMTATALADGVMHLPPVWGRPAQVWTNFVGQSFGMLGTLSFTSIAVTNVSASPPSNAHPFALGVLLFFCLLCAVLAGGAAWSSYRLMKCFEEGKEEGDGYDVPNRAQLWLYMAMEVPCCLAQLALACRCAAMFGRK